MAAKLGWTFNVDPLDGIPYFACPHCGRKVGGKKILFAYEAYETCPSCGKELHFDNIDEGSWIYLDTFYGADK